MFFFFFVLCVFFFCLLFFVFFFQAEDGIRDLVRSRGLGDVYKRQVLLARFAGEVLERQSHELLAQRPVAAAPLLIELGQPCLLYTSDAADERSSVDLGGRRIIKKKTGRLTARTTP